MDARKFAVFPEELGNVLETVVVVVVDLRFEIIKESIQSYFPFSSMSRLMLTSAVRDAFAM